MENKKINNITYVALVAALYTALSLTLNFFSYGIIQIRLAESLIVFAILSKMGIYGITIGCFLTNLFGIILTFNPLGLIDVFFGTFLTYLSGIFAYKFKDQTILKQEIPLLSLMMPVIFNMVGLPLMFAFVIHNKFSISVYFLEMLFIFVSQFIASVIIGSPLYIMLRKHFNFSN